MKVKKALVVLVAAGMLSAQAYATEAQVEAAIPPAQTAAVFTDADFQALFEPTDQPMQLAALSEQEMRETEGAWWLMPILGGVGSGLTYWYNNPSRNLAGLTVAVTTGAMGGALGRISGWGVGVGGSMYATHVTGWW